MSKPWLGLLREWMITKGTLVDGRPWRPMTAATVDSRLRSIKRVMCDLGYLRHVGEDWNSTSKKLRELRCDELRGWMNTTFPDSGSAAPNKWNVYARSLIKLVEWMHFEVLDSHGKPAFSWADVEAMHKFLRHRSVEMPRQPKLSEDFIARYERFLEWLKNEDVYLHAFAKWGFLSCMRYDEIRRMDSGLATGSVIKAVDGTMLVDGKRDRGKKAERELPPLAPLLVHLRWWDGQRFHLGVLGDALFPMDVHGTRWDELSATYNRRLRRWAKKSGLFTGDCNGRGDHPTGELEWFRSHIIGRHAGATSHGSAGSSVLDIQRLTGHKKAEILTRRYINIGAGDAARRLDAARTRTTNGNGHIEVRPVAPSSDLEAVRAALAALPRDELLGLLADVLQGVKA